MSNTESRSFIIRPMRTDDVGKALDLSMNEGWNQTLKDWELLLHNPDNVCIVAEKDQRVAGTATALNHGNKVAWIGMVLVDKSLRGQGAGKMLLESIIEKLRNVESLKLDATPAGEPLYRKLGFIEEYKIFRMTCDGLRFKSEKFNGAGISSIDMNSLPEIVKLDRLIFGADRSYLLENLLKIYPEKAFLFESEGRPQGFIFGRDGSRFNYMGPVIALSEDSARNLISKALGALNDQSIALDVPEDKAGLISWLESVGFIKQRHFVRMYLKSNPCPGIIKNQYLISGPEFG
jgi:predicted GNAT family N-acyltransferase